jgi:HSP20 family protein
MTPREERGLSRSRAMDWVESPFRALQRFADEMDRMFDDFGLARRWQGSAALRESGGLWAPEVEVFHRNNELTIRADLPGLKREEVTVDVTDNAVTIQGERKREHREEQEGFYRTERSYGSFYRTIPLPEGAITDQAKASFRDGVLEITMPAPPASKGRRIEIAEGARK